MNDAHLITAALEKEVLATLRSHGIVVWLDKDGHYSAYVDRLVERYERGDFPFPVIPFRGSFLEAMLALEPHGNGLDPSPLLIHLPGYSDKPIRLTPMLEMYRAGHDYARRLDTLIREAATGRVLQAEIDRFIESGKITLEAADDWLGHLVAGSKEGLAGLLERMSIEVVVRELLVKDTFLSEHLRRDHPEDREALADYLSRQVGMDPAWVAFIRSMDNSRDEYPLMVDALASWLLSVEYVHDLARLPHLAELHPLRKLSKPIVKVCGDLVRSLREEHADRYEVLADQSEAHLEQELHAIKPEDLGKIDTFRTEEARVLEAAIGALGRGDWGQAKTWAEVRNERSSFWLTRDQRRRLAWRLVGDAANLGHLLEEHPRPFKDIITFEEALERYTGEACLVDQAHRRFEQRRQNLLDPLLPHYGLLREVVGEMRRRYRTWADNLARDFSGLCSSKGFLPDNLLQQRCLYEQVVHPLTHGRERTALFIIDSLRFEMAAELKNDFSEAGTTVSLKARLAELPTMTAVGMNALAPVAREGRLTLVADRPFKGFSNGEFIVDTPDARAKAMGMRSIGEQALRLSLAEVCEMESDKLKRRVAQKKLIIVHGREIDDAGEAGVGLATFEVALGQIRAAWHHLKAAGVKQFVFTADHGFLIMDETTMVHKYGKPSETSRRHIFDEARRMETGLVTASLSELGYDGVGGFLLFREDTAVFSSHSRGSNFAHGGNSPQERIIPVLTVTSKLGPNADLPEAYIVEAEYQSDALSYRRLRLRLRRAKQNTLSLPYISATPVDLALSVPERNDIRVKVKDVTGKGSFKGGRLHVPVDDGWTEVFFTLEGPEDEKVRVCVLHPENIKDVTPCTVEGWFGVEGKADVAVGTSSPGPSSLDWLENLPDEGTQRVFRHLAQHGVVNEAEATQMLGNARQFRQFSNKFEALLALTPLKVRIESTLEGKRYVKARKAE